MSRERPTPYGTEESLALENARLRGELRRERRRAQRLAGELEESERRRGLLEDRDRLLGGILDAWAVEGPMPNVHRRAQREVRHTMPVLVRRIEHGLRRR